MRNGSVPRDILQRTVPDAGKQPPGRGLDRIELALFVGGVLAFAFLMVVFGQPLAGELYVPVVVIWIALGLGFIWWFNRRLTRS
jgi:hypothetical protein